MAKKKTVDTKASVKTVKSTVTVKELRAKSAKELAEVLKTTKADLVEASRMHAAGELVNPRVLGNLRKTIARIYTLMVEKALEEVKGKEDSPSKLSGKGDN